MSLHKLAKMRAWDKKKCLQKRREKIKGRKKRIKKKRIHKRRALSLRRMLRLSPKQVKG